MKVKSTVMAVAFGFFGFALGAQDAMAAMIRANAHAAMYEHMDDSGEAGARLGTAVHNALFPSRPLPRGPDFAPSFPRRVCRVTRCHQV